MRQNIREHDFAARFGGEEFVLILVDAGIDGALTILKRVKDGLPELHPGVTFSAGIAVIESGIDATTATAAADTALYLAKQPGRDRWEIATAEPDQPDSRSTQRHSPFGPTGSTEVVTDDEAGSTAPRGARWRPGRYRRRALRRRCHRRASRRSRGPPSRLEVPAPPGGSSTR